MSVQLSSTSFNAYVKQIEEDVVSSKNYAKERFDPAEQKKLSDFINLLDSAKKEGRFSGSSHEIDDFKSLANKALSEAKQKGGKVDLATLKSLQNSLHRLSNALGPELKSQDNNQSNTRKSSDTKPKSVNFSNPNGADQYLLNNFRSLLAEPDGPAKLKSYIARNPLSDETAKALIQFISKDRQIDVAEKSLLTVIGQTCDQSTINKLRSLARSMVPQHDLISKAIQNGINLKNKSSASADIPRPEPGPAPPDPAKYREFEKRTGQLTKDLTTALQDGLKKAFKRGDISDTTYHAIKSLLTPENMAWMTAMMTAYAAAHATPVAGVAIGADLLMLASALFYVGSTGIDIAKDLYSGYKLAAGANGDAKKLDQASDAFSSALSKGVAASLLWMLQSRFVGFASKIGQNIPKPPVPKPQLVPATAGGGAHAPAVPTTRTGPGSHTGKVTPDLPENPNMEMKGGLPTYSNHPTVIAGDFPATSPKGLTIVKHSKFRTQIDRGIREGIQNNKSNNHLDLLKEAFQKINSAVRDKDGNIRTDDRNGTPFKALDNPAKTVEVNGQSFPILEVKGPLSHKDYRPYGYIDGDNFILLGVTNHQGIRALPNVLRM